MKQQHAPTCQLPTQHTLSLLSFVLSFRVTSDNNEQLSKQFHPQTSTLCYIVGPKPLRRFAFHSKQLLSRGILTGLYLQRSLLCNFDACECRQILFLLFNRLIVSWCVLVMRVWLVTPQCCPCRIGQPKSIMLCSVSSSEY